MSDHHVIRGLSRDGCTPRRVYWTKKGVGIDKNRAIKYWHYPSSEMRFVKINIPTYGWELINCDQMLIEEVMDS